MSSRRLLPAALALSAAALVACGTAAVEASEVENQAQEQFSQQFPVDSVSCDEDLPAEVGATATCVLESEGQAFEMTATVTSVEGDQANFDLELTSEIQE